MSFISQNGSLKIFYDKLIKYSNVCTNAFCAPKFYMQTLLFRNSVIIFRTNLANLSGLREILANFVFEIVKGILFEFSAIDLYDQSWYSEQALRL
ncbi:hypothetical protein BpHYR1_035146 [Brachionus plicatilis]|uniref:Uncharacterized protein n=1 Tax=Brachionus plicatilis TaxID=10195 RepID=A0A3M7SDT8_BRAPC|nr:hypothetical protein BpHYR1_035146 [Brachionus plicatilis]